MKGIFSAVTILSAAIAVRAADPMMVMQCQVDYANKEESTPECEALATLAKCFALGGVDTLPPSDSTRKLADDFLLGQQAKANCHAYEQEAKPAIRTERGDMEFDVDGTKDIKIYRFRRESVSLFDMAERLEAVETEMDGLPAKLSDVEKVANEGKVAAEALETRISGDIDDVAKKVDAQKSAMGSLTSSLNTKISQATSGAKAARSALKSELQKSIDAGVQQAKSTASSALNAEKSKNSGKFSAIDASVAAAEAKLAALDKTVKEAKSFVVGWTQCNQVGANGADHNNFVAMTCSYTKKKDDTIMYISVNSNQRQINGNSIWKMQMRTPKSSGWRECAGPGNNRAGSLYTRYHGSRSVDLHRPMFIGGACYQTNNNQKIPKGKVEMRYIQTYVTSDSYWNWESSARMIMEERMPMN